MPHSFTHEQKTDSLTFRFEGVVSDHNVVQGDVSLISSSGEITGRGSFEFPLRASRRFAGAFSGAMAKIAQIPPHKAYTLDEYREREGAPHSHTRWLPEEDEKLRREFLAGMPIEAIAQEHQRIPGAIRSRLVKLGQIEPEEP